MTVAIYALSYKDTGSVLSYCFMEQQQLKDKASASALRDRLVGDNFVFSLSTANGTPFKLAKADVNVDEITVANATLPLFTRQPYAYVLDLSAPNSASGDGTPKSIMTTPLQPTYKLASNTPPAGFAANAFTVTFSTQLGPPKDLYLIFDGQPVMLDSVMTPTNPVVFQFATTLTTGSLHAVGFFAKGVQPFVGFVQAA